MCPPLQCPLLRPTPPSRQPFLHNKEQMLHESRNCTHVRCSQQKMKKQRKGTKMIWGTERRVTDVKREEEKNRCIKQKRQGSRSEQERNVCLFWFPLSSSKLRFQNEICEYVENRMEWFVAGERYCQSGGGGAEGVGGFWAPVAIIKVKPRECRLCAEAGIEQQ